MILDLLKNTSFGKYLFCSCGKKVNSLCNFFPSKSLAEPLLLIFNMISFLSTRNFRINLPTTVNHLDFHLLTVYTYNCKYTSLALSLPL